MKFAIIGAGVTGLSIGYFLSRSGHTVDIFESSSEIGGLAGTFVFKDQAVDKFYHHFYTNDTDAIALIGELGLSKNLIFQKTPTGMYWANRIYKLSSPLDLLRFKPLSFADRIRMGLLVLESQRMKDFSRLEKISARDWIISRAGAKAYGVMWQPLLESKFGEYADSVSAAWLWSKFDKRGGSRTSGGSESLGFLMGGLSLLTGKLRDQIEDAGSKVITGTAVNKILTAGKRATGLSLSSGDQLWSYDRIVSTVSTVSTASMLDPSLEGYKDELLKIGYLGNITLVLFLKKSLSQLYWLNVNDPGCPFVGVIEHADRTRDSSNGPLSVVYISKYLSRKDSYYSMDKGKILGHYLPWLFKIFPSFNDADIADSFLWRADCAQPVISQGYREIIPAVDTPVGGLHLVTMAQIFPEDRQISNAIKNAKAFAERFGK